MLQVLIVSYETFRLHCERFRRPGACDLLICDEAHRLKNDQTLTNKARPWLDSAASLPAAWTGFHGSRPLGAALCRRSPAWSAAAGCCCQVRFAGDSMGVCTSLLSPPALLWETYSRDRAVAMQYRHADAERAGG